MTTRHGVFRGSEHLTGSWSLDTSVWGEVSERRSRIRAKSTSAASAMAMTFPPAGSIIQGLSTLLLILLKRVFLYFPWAE